MVFFTLNFFVWGEKSSGAVPFGTMFALLVLWFGISVPLVFLGSYFGYRRKAGELPVRINQIPRQVPEQVWYMQPTFSVIVGGVLPFGAVFIELFFIMSSVWLQRFYYVFGFLALVILILLVTCAEVRRAQEIARRRAVLSPSRPLAGAMSARARALRSRLCSATFNCATRITTGGGALSSIRAPLGCTSSATLSSTSSLSSRWSASSPSSSTSPT